MILYDQRILIGDPSGRPGDCVRAAVATLVQEPLDAVPHFVEAPDWMKAVLDWRPALLEIDWSTAHGPIAFPVVGSTQPVVVGIGQSPRGTLHAVVLSAKNGTLVHDPHPSRVGLSGPVEFIIVAVR